MTMGFVFRDGEVEQIIYSGIHIDMELGRLDGRPTTDYPSQPRERSIPHRDRVDDEGRRTTSRADTSD
jgi:hypothetical protein